MPNGYTSLIYDGTDDSFKGYALICARAFGACIMQKDDPLDVPPQLQTPSDYNENRVKVAQKELGEIQSLIVTDCQALADAEYEEAVQRREAYIQTTLERRARYDAMIAKVAVWSPPTEDHINFKTFMLEQLHTSKKWDCGDENEQQTIYPIPERIDGETWRQNKIRSLRKDIEYHTKHHEEEVARVASRNQWLIDLFDSLKGA
jgi:hypothetical protein